MSSEKAGQSAAGRTGDMAILELDRVSKSFDRHTVLDARQISIRPGYVYGLLGANGSGKSTLVKALAGYHAPDPGSAGRLRGQPIHWPLRTASSGIAVVPQDQALAVEMSIVDNFLVTRRRYRSLIGRVTWRDERGATSDSLRRVGLHRSPEDTVASLTAAERALVEIARSLEEILLTKVSSPLLILDEPTANLAQNDVERVFAATREIADQGGAVIIVNHRMSEVRASCDYLYVLRDGQVAFRGPGNGSDSTEVVTAMFGRAVAASASRMGEKQADPAARRALLLRLSSFAEMSNIGNVDVSGGEVVGITGLVGMGQDILPYQIMGLRKRKNLSVATHGGVLGGGPLEACAAGLALLPADRPTAAFWPAGTVLENYTIGRLSTSTRRLALLSGREHREATMRMISDWNVQADSPDAAMRTLSGGNQQKVQIARAIDRQKCTVLIAHEPTQGIDVAARREVLSALRAFATMERAVIVCGADYEALAEVCDRVIVLKKGSAPVTLCGSELSEESIAQCAMDTAAAVQ